MLLAAAQTGCNRHEHDAVNLDIPTQDCYFGPRPRPDDCAKPHVCMWTDANIRISSASEGAFHVEADAGWSPVPGEEMRSIGFDVSSTEKLASRLPQLLSELHDQPPPVEESCIYLDPDQAMRFGDVVAFYEELHARNVRRVGAVQRLAE